MNNTQINLEFPLPIEYERQQKCIKAQVTKYLRLKRFCYVSLVTG